MMHPDTTEFSVLVDDLCEVIHSNDVNTAAKVIAKAMINIREDSILTNSPVAALSMACSEMFDD